MTGLEEKHSVISKEDMQSAMDFVEDFSHELEKYPHRIAASKDETACARAIRNRLHDETDAKTRLEAFDASPLLGRGSFLLIGIWYAICYVMYFVSFAGGRVTGAMLTLLSLVMFLGGGSVFLLMYLGNSKLGKVLPKKCRTTSSAKVATTPKMPKTFSSSATTTTQRSAVPSRISILSENFA